MRSTPADLTHIEDVVDLDRHPLAGSAPGRSALVARCRERLGATGSFSLEGFLRPAALARGVAEVTALMERAAHRHVQRHNVWFTDDDHGLAPDHGAAARLVSANHALTCDRLEGTVVRAVYEWDPLADFLAATLDRARLHRMHDPLARLNVMGYGEGDALNWHFDRARFTVTLLLQAPLAGGVFQYRPGLRSESDPNHDGVARLLAGTDPQVRELDIAPGTLNVFAGRYAAHRLTPVAGSRMRLVAILSYAERADVDFSDADRVRFYGRAR